MSDLEIGRTLLLFAWGLGLAGIEIEIEGAYGWAERLPTWYLKRGSVGAVYGLAMSGRPLTGYHVFAFVIPLLVLHLPFVSGIDWSLAGELVTIGTYFALAVVWDYLWFVLNPAYTVRRFRKGVGLVVREAVDRPVSRSTTTRASRCASRSARSAPGRPAAPTCSTASCGCWPGSPC